MKEADEKNSGKEAVLTFEDLHTIGQKMGPLPSGYAGFTWSDGAWFMPKDIFSSICGGRYGLFNADGKDLIVTRERPFDLKALSLFTLWKDNAQVLVEGWDQQVRKYARTLTVRQRFVTTFDLDYRSIDRLILKAGGAHMVVNPITVFFEKW